ncbi:IS701 family transposase [Streptomyces sp. NPDC049949]|uniref:IS701 family transposase n=1 Tax=Streptomyces sp. NPDC049949 TaxID=3154627 RepID=UPI003424E87A
MWTDDETAATGHSMNPARWREAFEVAMGRMAGRFARNEPRLRAGRLILGLLSDLPRKNCWTIAEWAGEASPHVMRHLLCRASWDADAVRDDVREHVVEHLHDEAAVLVVDETGDVKKGPHTVGVQRHTGTAGRIENSQVAFYLIYAGARGHAAVDREPYVPRSWTRDPDRCRAAGLGEETVFATKPELARAMIERFMDAGHRGDWVTGDEVYGGNPKLRSALEECGMGYVLAVACSAEVTTSAGSGWKRPSKARKGRRGSTRIRFAATPPGPAGSPSRCLFTPSSQWSAPTNTAAAKDQPT